VLATLGVASSSAILFACGAAPKRARRPSEIDPEIRTWLREAVSILAGAGFDSPHALAVSRRRATAALDVLGAGVARGRCDGVVLSVRDKGVIREQVTNDLSQKGVLAAVRAIAGKAKAADIDFGAAPGPVEAVVPNPDALTDGEMLGRVGALASRDKGLSSRIVYAAATIDVDDAHVWSVAPGRMLEQRLVRVRRAITRVAWHGSRPFVGDVARAWTGGIDAQDLTDGEIQAAQANALVLLTPQAFEDGERAFLLEPAVGAALLDAAVRAISRRSSTAPISERVTLVDDPTVTDAYGGFRFDDSGAAATANTLVDKGKLVGRITRGRRAGHIGLSEVVPSHLRLAAGDKPVDTMLGEGIVLEGHINTLVDPSTDRFVIQIARAREQQAGRQTGRLFADVELVGELSKAFRELELSAETRSIGFRDEVNGQPRHRSIETPWMLGRGMVRQRRRPT
jgi:predicted Zn-dependent protease